MLKAKSTRLMLCCLMLLAFTLPALAQSSTDGAIGGTVYDSSGAVVPGAKVTVVNNGTNAAQETKADSSGYFRVAPLQPGSYTVSISASGFAAHKAERVIVQLGSVTEVTPHLS